METTKHPERPIRTQLDRFAAALAEHEAEATPPRKGGSAVQAAIKLGLSPSTGNGMLQRLRQELGWQAQ